MFNVHFLHFPDVYSLICCRLVGGSGDIKLTKDGNTLLKEMVSESEIYKDLALCFAFLAVKGTQKSVTLCSFSVRFWRCAVLD